MGGYMISNLSYRAIQIAASSSEGTDIKIIEFCHNLVRLITKKLLEKGATFVSIVGKDEKAKSGGSTAPSIIYYWDLLESVYEYAASKSFSNETRNLVTVVSSEKSEAQIPEQRKELWHVLIELGIVSLHRINPGWNAGAYRRQEQEKLSDALLILGGGEGVEHLVSLYVSHGKPVLPLDIPLGSSYGDGLGGAPHLSRFAVASPKRFIPRANNGTASRLASSNFERWEKSPEEYANSILDFLETIVKPQVFYVRLLNKDVSGFYFVENFFRKVVDPVVQNMNYHIKEMGRAETDEAFINIEIFKEINNSSIVIADLSGLRPNCFMEFGYAFGLTKKVLLTAKEGTKLPFDSSAIPCYFWNPDSPIQDQQESLLEFWNKNINRPPLISANHLF
jgi:hypothetical protein